MADNNTGAQKPDTVKLALLCAVLLAGVVAFGVHKYHAAQAQAAKMAAINSYIEQEPVFQMILEAHPAAKKFMYFYLGQGYDASGQDGLQPAADKLQWMFNQYYFIDYNWYAKADAVYTMVSYEYVIMQAIASDAKKKGQCNDMLQDKIDYPKLVKLVGEDTAHKYLEATRYIYLTARAKQLPAVWPGAANYDASVQQANFHIASQLMKLDPDGFQSMAERAFQSKDKLNCDDALEIYYSMLQLPHEEMALIWRKSIEDSEAKTKADRKKRNME